MLQEFQEFQEAVDKFHRRLYKTAEEAIEKYGSFRFKTNRGLPVVYIPCEYDSLPVEFFQQKHDGHLSVTYRMDKKTHKPPTYCTPNWQDYAYGEVHFDTLPLEAQISIVQIALLNADTDTI